MEEERIRKEQERIQQQLQMFSKRSATVTNDSRTTGPLKSAIPAASSVAKEAPIRKKEDSLSDAKDGAAEEEEKKRRKDAILQMLRDKNKSQSAAPNAAPSVSLVEKGTPPAGNESEKLEIKRLQDQLEQERIAKESEKERLSNALEQERLRLEREKKELEQRLLEASEAERMQERERILQEADRLRKQLEEERKREIESTEEQRRQLLQQMQQQAENEKQALLKQIEDMKQTAKRIEEEKEAIRQQQEAEFELMREQQHRSSLAEQRRLEEEREELRQRLLELEERKAAEEQAPVKDLCSATTENSDQQVTSSYQFSSSEPVHYVDSPDQRLSDFEAELLYEINLARTNPSAYVSRVEKQLHWFSKSDDTLFTPPHSHVSIRTTEGRAALQEAIEALRSASPVGPLQPVKGLSLAAREVVEINGSQGLTGTVEAGAPGSRVDKHGQWVDRINELFSYGPLSSSASCVCVQWLIDDGNRKRSQRSVLLSPSFTKIGIASDTHTKYQFMSSAILCCDFSTQKTSSSSSPSVPSESSKMEETADGSAYIIRTLETDVPKENLQLLKLPTQLVLVRTARTESKTETLRSTFTLPFAIPSSNVTAEYDPVSTRLLITLAKQLSADSSEVLIQSFPITAVAAAATNRVKVGIAQKPDSFVFEVAPCLINAEIQVKIVQGTSLVIESTYAEESDEGIKTTTQRSAIKIPFPLSVSQIHSVLPSDTNQNTASVIVMKPSPIDEPNEVVIPIV